MLAIYRMHHCHIEFVLEFFFIHKNLHIEPFNCAIKCVCFNFGLGYIASSVMKTGRKVNTFLPVSMITYLTFK